jgi:hypothetical protein
MPCGFIAPRALSYLAFQSSMFSLPDEGYSRNASCALNLLLFFYYTTSRPLFPWVMCRNYYPVEMMTDSHTNHKGYTRPNNNKINPMFSGVCQGRVFLLKSVVRIS